MILFAHEIRKLRVTSHFQGRSVPLGENIALDVGVLGLCMYSEILQPCSTWGGVGIEAGSQAANRGGLVNHAQRNLMDYYTRKNKTWAKIAYQSNHAT